jgi:selenocysteine-specific elongation factor
MSRGELEARVETLAGKGDVIALGEPSSLMTAEGFGELASRCRSALDDYHMQHPLRAGMPREELRSKLGLNEAIFASALKRWADDDVVSDSGASIGRAGWTPELSEAQRAAADAYVASLSATPYSPPTDGQPPADVLEYLRQSGQVVPLSGGITFARPAYDEMVDRVTEHLRGEGTITLAQVRDMFGTSRKYAQALLEHLDQERVTRRVGDERVLRGG